MTTLTNRRQALQALALGACAMGAGGRALAQRPAAAIDVHHHYLPPFYVEHAREWMLANGSGSPRILQWSPEQAAEALQAAGVETAVLSISSPGFATLPSGLAAEMARRCNAYAADLARGHGRQFRFLTALPMPDVEASVAEIAHGYDLGASGVGLLTNYDGKYLGDPAFEPVFAELDRRAAIVHVHPTDAPCCRGLIPYIPTPTLEFAVDTGRTITDLLWSGTFSRYPRIRFIFSHGGGIIPAIYSRITGLNAYVPALAAKVPEGPVAALARLYADTASLSDDVAFAGASRWLGPDRLLFGSDYPWSLPAATLQTLDGLTISDALRSQIRRGNALKLFGDLI